MLSNFLSCKHARPFKVILWTSSAKQPISLVGMVVGSSFLEIPASAEYFIQQPLFQRPQFKLDEKKLHFSSNSGDRSIPLWLQAEEIHCGEIYCRYRIPIWPNRLTPVLASLSKYGHRQSESIRLAWKCSRGIARREAPSGTVPCQKHQVLLAL